MHRLRPVAIAIARHLHVYLDKLRTWWERHRRRLAEEMDYAEAFAAVVIAAVDLIGGSYQCRYAIRELVRAYIALQRIFSPPMPDTHH
ncbi:hypothetical protein ENKNEFLB_03601 [Nocardioides aquaticus]|uniref:Uncharacterized protein n=2 Tax=Nocardioides aquaticus TaxID=160826 RepID=A0ABX8EKY1_9ACTN|nr:hypothetical protein ENKNEFLB_03601 [Nocardioides aquaticus]